jgi:hypothetical protein
MKSKLWTSSENDASLHKATRENHIPMFQHSSKVKSTLSNEKEPCKAWVTIDDQGNLRI